MKTNNSYYLPKGNVYKYDLEDIRCIINDLKSIMDVIRRENREKQERMANKRGAK